MTRRAVCALAVIVTTVAVCAPAAPAGQQAVDAPDVLAESGVALERVAVYVHGLDVAAIETAVAVLLERVADHVNTLEAEARARTAAPAAVRPAPRYLPGAVSGDCYAGPIPAAIVTRESGGDPTAVNSSSGAYGCFQIMPYVWAANCADLDRGVSGQITCAGRISNGGSNLGPWAG